MSYTLSAFIAQSGTFTPFQALSPCITIVPLAQGFEMILNDEFLRDAIESQPEFAQAQPRLAELKQAQLKLAQEHVVEGYPTDLTEVLVAFGLSLSRQQLIAYVEASFWGGMGEQYAVLWQDGQAILLPVTNGLTSERYHDHGFAFLKDAPINSVLRVLGVQIERTDEFASIGLMMERDMSGWFDRFNTHPNKDRCKPKR